MQAVNKRNKTDYKWDLFSFSYTVNADFTRLFPRNCYANVFYVIYGPTRVRREVNN